MSLKEILNDIRTPHFLISEIDAYYRELPDIDDSHSDGYIHPSSISLCSRRIQYYLEKVERQKGVITPQTKRVFDNGKDFHRRIQKILIKRNVLLKENEEKKFVVEDIHLSGKCDGIVILNGKEYIIELKSANSKYFSDIKKSGVPQHYLTQVHCYMMGHKIPQAIFLFENKDTQELHEIVVEENNHISSMIKIKCKKILKMRHDKILCPRECLSKDEGNTKKVNCPYVDICFSDNFKFADVEEQLDFLEVQ